MNTASTSSSILHGAIAALVAGSAFTVADADAATSRTHYYSAVAVCAGPIPSSDGNLRRNPLGIRNDGDVNVWISCSVPGDFVGDQVAGLLQPYFHHFGTGNATINCTLVAGNRFNGYALVTGATNIAGGGDAYVSWDPVDKISAYGSYNFQCILPPDVELGLIYFQQEDAGGGL